MQSLAVQCKRSVTIVALLTLALLLALPIPAGAQDMQDDSVFVSIRVYNGVEPADRAEIVRHVDQGFLSIMRESDGFVAYYLLPAGDQLAAVSLFDSAEQAAASNQKARAYVAEFMAPLLPNAPLIVEGTIDIMHVAGLDDASSLYASLRIYDNANVNNREEASDSVRAHLLPSLIEAGGLFSYYTLNDHVDTVAALNVYDSEATALAANDIAAAYVAEYGAVRLPEDPLRISGQLGVAALAALNMGENLIDVTMMDAVFASVRVYDGIDPTDQDEIARLTDAGFLPIIRESEGFVGYFFLQAEDMLATVSLFDSAEQAAASNEAAREFVAENLAPLLPNAPRIYEGPLAIDYVASLSEGDVYSEVDELYTSIRFYEGFDLSHFAEATDLASARLLPALKELAGLFAHFAFNDGEDTVVGISIFQSEEGALAANDAGIAFTAEYLADWAPNPPSGVSGKLAIAALAEIQMGENLVGAMMDR